MTDTDTAADHVALAVRRAGWWTGDPTSDEIAAELLGALREAGYVVVSVPKDSVGRDLDMFWRIKPTTEPYPPNTVCACGELIHPDMPYVWAEADGALWHGNPDGGGHCADVPT